MHKRFRYDSHSHSHTHTHTHAHTEQFRIIICIFPLVSSNNDNTWPSIMRLSRPAGHTHRLVLVHGQIVYDFHSSALIEYIYYMVYIRVYRALHTLLGYILLLFVLSVRMNNKWWMSALWDRLIAGVYVKTVWIVCVSVMCVVRHRLFPPNSLRYDMLHSPSLLPRFVFTFHWAECVCVDSNCTLGHWRRWRHHLS